MVPWIAAAILFALLVLVDAAAIRSLDGGPGLAPWLQAAWRHRHGGAGTPLGGPDPIMRSWSFVAWPLVALTRLIPATAVFVVVQAGAIALGVVPLWRLARREAELRVGASTAVLGAYALAPTLQRTNLSAFHPEVIALPALLAAFLCARRRWWRRYVVLIGLVLLCRADLGLTVATLGLLLMVDGRRRAGVLTAAAGAAWTAAALVILRPGFPSGRLSPAAQFVARSTTPLAALTRLVSHPLAELHDLFAEPSLVFLVLVFAPLLFLPLVAPRYLSPALPSLALAMLADRAVQRASGRALPADSSSLAAHIAPAMAFVFIATTFALSRMGRRSVARINVDHRLLLALTASALVFFATDSPTSPYQRPWGWGGRDDVDEARLAALAGVARRTPIAVSPELTASAAGRPAVTELVGPTVTARSLPRSTRAIVLDTTGVDGSGRPLWSDRRRRATERALTTAGFQIVSSRAGIVTLLR